MDERAHGLILRTRPLTETSLIVNWLTADQGRISTVAKGARRAKSVFRGKLDIFYSADFSFQRSRRSELHNLREVNLLETRSALREHIGYLQQASYCAKLIEQTTEAETPLGGVHQLMHGLLNVLSAQPPRALTIFAFEIKLLTELGLQPDFEDLKLNAGSRHILEKAVVDDWPSLGRLKLSSGQIGELTHFLHGHLIYHCGRVPSGRATALQED